MRKPRRFCSKIQLGFALLLSMVAAAVNGQNPASVSGTITDANGPLLGVTVTVKGTTSGVISDSRGSYTINVPDRDAVLVFSFIGYATQEITAGNRTVIDVVMSESTQAIDEVVVVGYGAQRKVNLTGAVGVVSGHDIASKASTDVVNAMMGQIPGLLVTRNSGQPGAETSGIRIRGFTSVNSASALILIDGVEGSLNTLNAEDIESVSVLKDAASASIYGSRAAAGVVLVTTKKGTAEKTKVNYNGSFGLNVPGLIPKRVTPWEDYEWIHQSLYNVNPAFVINREAVEMIANPNHNYRVMGTRWEEYYATNWMDLGMKDYTTQHTHSLSVTGGNEKTQYYVSGGYYAKDGILKYGPDNNNRTNFRASLNTEINKYLDFNVQLSYEGTRTKENTYGAAETLSRLYSKSGYHGLYNPPEDTYYDTDPYSNGSANNPIQIMKEGGEVRNQSHYYTGFAGLRIKEVVKNLTLDLNFSRRGRYEMREGDYRFIRGHGRNGAERPTHVNNPQRTVKSKANSYQDKMEALLNYDLKTGEHHIHILGGASYEQYLRDYISGEARNGISNDFFSFNYYDNSEAANSILSDAVQPWKMASLFGRVNYEFADRYLFEVNLRYDGSSRLSPDNRWGLFPSASVGWRISEEAFFQSAKRIVNGLKLRASWGELGNSTALSSDYYPYLDMISRATFWSAPVYFTNALVSRNIKWETITSTNVGVDLSFLNSRLEVSADYYWKSNNDMLARLKTGNIIGIANLPLENVGVLKTWGWELSLQWRDRIGDFSYHAGFSIDDNRNRLVKYTGNNVVAEGLVQYLEGYPINTIWGYRTDGFWKSRDEYLAYKAANPGYESIEQDGIISGGDVRYLTQGKADHKIGVGAGSPQDPGDLVQLGTESPRYMYGINLGLEWKGIDFSMFWQGVGYRRYIVTNTILGPMVNTGQTPFTIHRDHWTENNQDAYFARLTGNMAFNYHPSDRWVQNGAYLRLKNIQLGYTIPMPENVVQSLRVYVTGSDVWEYTRAFKVFDPEARSGVNASYYPFFRTWTFGVNLTF